MMAPLHDSQLFFDESQPLSRSEPFDIADKEWAEFCELITPMSFDYVLPTSPVMEEFYALCGITPNITHYPENTPPKDTQQDSTPEQFLVSCGYNISEFQSLIDHCSTNEEVWNCVFDEITKRMLEDVENTNATILQLVADYGGLGSQAPLDTPMQTTDF